MLTKCGLNGTRDPGSKLCDLASSQHVPYRLSFQYWWTNWTHRRWFSNSVTWLWVVYRRTPESPLRGMFQAPGPYVRMQISPPTRLCPDFDTDIRSDPIGVRMIAYTSKKIKIFSRFPYSSCGNVFYSFCIHVAQEIKQNGYLLP